MQKTKFMPEHELRLVHEVEKRPILWDATSESYKRADLKHGIWEEIARNLGSQFSGAEASQKFKNLKDTFTRNLRKVEGSCRSGAGSDDIYKPKMPLYKQLMFLQKVTKQSASTSNIPTFDAGTIASQDSQQIKDVEPSTSSLQQTETASSTSLYFDENLQSFMVLPSDDYQSESSAASALNSPSEQSGPSSPLFIPPRPASAPVSVNKRPVEDEQMYTKKGVKRSNTTVVDEAVKMMRELSKPVAPPPEIGVPDREEVFGSWVATRFRSLSEEKKKECENSIMSVLLQF